LLPFIAVPFVSEKSIYANIIYITALGSYANIFTRIENCPVKESYIAIRILLY